jgi:hypothetical protein
VTNNRRLLYLFLGAAAVILGVVIMVGVRWLRSPAFSLVYGIKPVASVLGRQIYLKRAAGLNYDRMALSLNGDRCADPDTSTDYLFASLGAGEFPVYYVAGEKGIAVYDHPLSPPADGKWSIVIEEKTIVGEPHFGRRPQDYNSRGISSTQLLLSDLKPCSN